MTDQYPGADISFVCEEISVWCLRWQLGEGEHVYVVVDCPELIKTHPQTQREYLEEAQKRFSDRGVEVSMSEMEDATLPTLEGLRAFTDADRHRLLPENLRSKLGLMGAVS